jgi:hypothetical protein
MIIDQFRDYGRKPSEIDDLKIRARIDAVASQCATDFETFEKYRKRSNVYAHKAFELENYRKPQKRMPNTCPACGEGLGIDLQFFCPDCGSFIHEIKPYTSEDQFELENNQRRLTK